MRCAVLASIAALALAEPLAEPLAELAADDECSGTESCALNAMQLRMQKASEAQTTEAPTLGQCALTKSKFWHMWEGRWASISAGKLTWSYDASCDLPGSWRDSIGQWARRKLHPGGSIVLATLPAPDFAPPDSSIPGGAGSPHRCLSLDGDLWCAPAGGTMDQAMQAIDAQRTSLAEAAGESHAAPTEVVASSEAALIEGGEAERQACFNCVNGCRLNYMNPPVIKKCPAQQPWYVVQRDYCVSSCAAPAPGPHYQPPAPAPHYQPPAPAPHYQPPAPAPHYQPPAPAPHTTAKPSHKPPPAHPGSCMHITTGTCKIMGCSKSRGPTKCVKGVCQCAVGACATKDKKMCLPEMPAHR